MLKNCGRRVLATLFIAALLNLSQAVPLAAPVETTAKVSGELMVLGMVRVDGVRMLSGATILSGSTIMTEQKSGALVGLGQLGRIELSPESLLRLDFDEAGLMGQLETGRLRVSLPAKASGSISFPGGAVVAHNDVATLFTIEIKEGRALVAAQAGRVELRAGEQSQQLAAGQEAMAGGLVNGPLSPAVQSQTAQNSGGGRLKGLVVAISGVLAAIGLIVIFHRNDNPHESMCSGTVISLSPGGGSGEIQCTR